MTAEMYVVMIYILSEDREANTQCCWFHYGNTHVKADEVSGLLAARGVYHTPGSV
jgi:hypothetical protein